ncbi:MAG: hypothetical protein WDN26_07440 [Chitinophagaceae bacterium]
MNEVTVDYILLTSPAFPNEKYTKASIEAINMLNEKAFMFYYFLSKGSLLNQ